MNNIEQQPGLNPAERNPAIPANYLLENGNVMPAGLVKELNPVQPGTSNARFQKELLEKIRVEELKREGAKEARVNTAYAALNNQEQGAFNDAKNVANDMLARAIKGEHSFDDLSAEEQWVMAKLREAYNKAKEQNPKQPINLQLSDEVDQKVYANLLNLQTLSITKNNPEVLDSAQSGESATISTAEDLKDPSKFGQWRTKSGETAPGVFWNEYHNTAAKELKESGELQWAKERIYFDLPVTELTKLRDLCFKIAKDNKIAIAFKHLDIDKTSPINYDETRFATNFASIEDAKRFYQAISADPTYQQFQPDRQRDYAGFQLDPIAHYANGYREKRTALKAIADTAQKNPDNTYTYTATNGKQITIAEENYKNFIKQLSQMPDPKKVWEQA